MAILQPEQQAQQDKSNRKPTRQQRQSRNALPSWLRIVAAGKGTTMSHPRIVDAVLSMVVRDKQEQQDTQQQQQVRLPITIRVVYIGTATFDNVEKRQGQTAGLAAAGCEIVPLCVSERVPVEQRPTADQMRDTILSAHVILVSGGNTLYAVQRWKTLGMDAWIRQAARKGTVLCGGSAGAISWFQQGHSQSQNPAMQLHVDPETLTDQQKRDWKYMVVDGLGFLPGFCIPHHDVAQSNGVWRETDSNDMMMTMMMRRELEMARTTNTTRGIGIDEHAALVIQGNRARVVSTTDGARCCIKYCCPENGDGGDDNGDDGVVVYPFHEKHGSVPALQVLTNPSQVLDEYYKSTCTTTTTTACSKPFEPLGSLASLACV